MKLIAIIIWTIFMIVQSNACIIKRMVPYDPCVISSYAARTDFRIAYQYNKNKDEDNKWQMKKTK